MKFLSKTSVGLDISDNSIEVIELSDSGGKYKVESSARISLQDGIVEKGRILNPEFLAQSLRTVFRLAKPKLIEPKNIVFGLPEFLVFTHLYSDIEIGSVDSVERVVRTEAYKSIPLDKNDLIFSYKNFSREKDRISGVINAVSKKDLIEWQNFFKDIDFEVEIFETKTNALLRAISGKYTKYPLCLVDIGGSETNISIFDHTGVVYSDTISIGGEAITLGIAEDLNIADLKEAEKMKREIGLSEPGSKLCNCIIKTIDGLVHEVEESIQYIEGKLDKKIEITIFSGGTTLVPGIIDYFQTNLEVETIRAQSAIVGLKESSEQVLYLKAAGLAKRNLDDAWAIDTVFPQDVSSIRGKEDKKKKTKIKKTRTSINLPTKSQKKAEPTSLLGRIMQHEKEVLLLLLTVALVALLVFAFKGNSEPETNEAVLPPEVIALLENIPQAEPAEVPNQNTPVTTSETKLPEDVGTSEGEKDLIEKVVIAETPTGWLNVRSGPGTSFDVIERIYPQEEYILLGRDGNWYIIKLSENTDGWISSDYAEVLPNS